MPRDAESAVPKDRTGRPACRPAGLLNHVCEFMREQPPAVGTAGRVPSGVKHDAVAEGISQRAKRAGGAGSGFAGVNLDLAEVVAEPQLHKAAGLRVEWTG